MVPARMSNEIPIPIAPAIAERYRQETVSLREAADIVRDEGLREQLLSIADRYAEAALAIEMSVGWNLTPTLHLDLPQAAD